MNPLASTKYTGRLLMALAVISTILFAAGCGTNNSVVVTPPPGGSFSDSNLSGTYVFSTSGSDIDGVFLSLAGTLVADGKGGIASGTMDVVDPEVPALSPVAQAITGSYNVGVDGRGQAKLTSTGYGTFVLDFVLTSVANGVATDGLASEFDGNGTGSGTIDLQTPIASLSQLQGPYAFSLAGYDVNDNPDFTVGAFTLDQNGDITVGVQDFNDFRFPYLQLAIPATTGALTLGTGTGPGQLVLTTGTFGTLHFDFYPVDATHLKLIETDIAPAPVLAGDVFTQTGASIPNGPAVFTLGGLDSNSNPVFVGGVMTSGGQGNFTAGLEDANDDGSLSPAQLSFSGSLDAANSGPTGSRTVVNTSGFYPYSNAEVGQWVIYPSSGGLLILETDNSAMTTGAAFAQTSTTLSTSPGYGFNLSAINLGNPNFGQNPYEEDDIAEFTTTSTEITGAVDINDQGLQATTQGLTGTYPIPIDSTGRGGVSTSVFNYYFYVVSPSTFLLLETDANQVGAGAFEEQSSLSSQAAAAKSHISMVRPVVRLHPALRRK